MSSKDISNVPPWQSVVGISLALISNAFIGASVVFRKRGLLDIAAQGHDVTTGSTAYLRNSFWWAGMILLAIGELSNFGAYAFSPAILVTPLGTLSVVISTILSNYVLQEKLNFLGKTGCALCIIGVIMIVTHAPTAQATDTIPDFAANIINPVFLVYTFIAACLILWLIYYAEPKFGKQTPFVYIAMSSTGGAYLVLSAQGVGSSIVTSARNWNTANQFLQWPMYPLIVFMILTVVFQIHYLNKALAVYSTAIVYPIHYVCFTGMTMVSTAFLFREFPVSSIDAGGSIIEGFIILAIGVVLLYKSQFDLTQQVRASEMSVTARTDLEAPLSPTRVDTSRKTRNAELTARTPSQRARHARAMKEEEEFMVASSASSDDVTEVGSAATGAPRNLQYNDLGSIPSFSLHRASPSSV